MGVLRVGMKRVGMQQHMKRVGMQQHKCTLLLRVNNIRTRLVLDDANLQARWWSLVVETCMHFGGRKAHSSKR